MSDLQEKIIEIGEMSTYSAKLYNILALSLIRSGKQGNADKIFKKALEELKLIEDKQMIQ